MKAVPLDDRGLLLGDGLFETILVRDGAPVLWEDHLARLAAGCAVLGLPPPGAGDARAACDAALSAASVGAGRAALRLTLTAGSGGRGLDRPAAPQSRLFATAAPAPAATTPARLVTAGVRRNAASPASRLKTLAYLDNVLARREAADAGADEAVMLSTGGHVACAAAANLFWLREGRLCTPALDCGVLAGIMRGRVIAAARSAGAVVEEVRVGAAELAAAEAAFLTNSLMGVRAVSALDGRALAPSPMLPVLQAWVAPYA